MHIFETVEDAIHKIRLNIEEMKEVQLPVGELTYEESERLGEALSQNHHLQHLVLSGNNINDGKLEEILKSLNPSLKIIDLSHNQISFLGTAFLAQKSFARINLSHNEMTNDALESFAESSRGASLHSLDFSHNEICAPQKKTLLDLVKNNESLVELQLDGNDISPAILKEITAVLQRRADILQGRVAPSVDVRSRGEGAAAARLETRMAGASLDA